MAIATDENLSGWSPDKIVELPLGDIIPESHLVTMTTFAGDVDGDAPAVRVPFVSADPSAAVTAEGAEITPADATLADVVIQTEKVATLSKVSRELVAQPGNQRRLMESVRRAVQAQANLQVMGDFAAASENFTDGGEVGTNFDAIADLITDLQAGGATPSHIVMRSADWKALSAVKVESGSNMPLVGVGTDPSQPLVRSLFGLPVVVTNDLPAGDEAANSILVISKTDMVAAYGKLAVAVSNDVYFTSDSVGIRATLRYGVKPARDSRHGVLSGVTESEDN